MNGTMMQYFEWYYPADGSLWTKVKQEAGRLANLGIDALWLPPAYKGCEGAHTNGYDVYDLYDLGEFDQKNSVRTKWGTRRQYQEAIDALHAAGIRVYIVV
jgi:alpha-amylase